jgi:hypothetical protein
MSSSKTAAAVILSVLVVILILSLLLKASFHEPANAPDGASPGSVLWESRDFETILQGLLILGGVVAILMLLRSSKAEAQR